jgi:hypothetical protein
MTNDPDIRAAKSIVDYIFRWIGKKFLTTDQQEEIGILSAEVRARLAQSYAALEGRTADAAAVPVEAAPPGQTALFNAFEDAQECARCGVGHGFGTQERRRPTSPSVMGGGTSATARIPSTVTNTHRTQTASSPMPANPARRAASSASPES